MPEPLDVLASYREVVQGLRRSAGPIGPLLGPLELTADVLEQVLARQQELERQLSGTIQPLADLIELARDAPAALRTQAKAFEAAALSFSQAAVVMNGQAELLEKTYGVLNVPKGIVGSVRSPGSEPPEDDG